MLQENYVPTVTQAGHQQIIGILLQTTMLHLIIFNPVIGQKTKTKSNE